MATIRKCQFCGKESVPEGILLLTCINCKRHWHHMCVLPRIPEAELMSLIHASSPNLQASSVDWLCRKCQNRASTSTAVGTSTRQSSLPTSRAPSVIIEVDSISTEPSSRAASKQISRRIDAGSSRSATKHPTHGTRPAQRSTQPEVIELLEDSDDDIMEITPPTVPQPVPFRKPSTKLSRSPTILGTPPAPEGREDNVMQPAISRPTSVVYPDPRRSGEPSTLKKVRSAVVTMQLDTPTNTPSASPAIQAPPRQASPEPVRSMPQIPIPLIPPTAGSSSTPDIRKLIADMRAQGRLGPSPGDVVTSRLLAYSSRADEIPGGAEGPSAPDSDVEMEDAEDDTHDPVRNISLAPEHEDPNDLEDMYADPPEPVKKEEPADVPLVHNSASRRRKEIRKDCLPGWIRDYEEMAGPDTWTTAFHNKAARISERKAAGVLLPRKAQARGNKRKHEPCEVIRQTGTGTEDEDLEQSARQQWTTGLLVLERLFE